MLNVGQLSLLLEPVETPNRRETTSLVFSTVNSYNEFPMSSLSTSESVVVKELFVSSKTPVQEHENMVAVFDFDHTIVDGNSDLVARDLIKPPNLIPDRKDYHNWTEYMQQIFNVLKNIEISAEQIIEVVSLMSSIQGMPKLMKLLKRTNIDIIVASDSNTLFIQNWLNHNKLLDIVSCVYTNPAKIEDGLISIEPYTVQTTCNNCQKNMCKGLIVQEHVAKADKKYSKIFYFGDGKNDLCPILRLTQNDLAFPRSGYVLDNLLKSYIIPAKIIPWCTGDDIYEYLKCSKIISISDNK